MSEGWEKGAYTVHWFHGLFERAIIGPIYRSVHSCQTIWCLCTDVQSKAMLGLIGSRNARHFPANVFINALMCTCLSNAGTSPLKDGECENCCGSFSEVRGLMLVFVVLIYFSSTCTLCFVEVNRTK